MTPLACVITAVVSMDSMGLENTSGCACGADIDGSNYGTTGVNRPGVDWAATGQHDPP